MVHSTNNIYLSFLDTIIDLNIIVKIEHWQAAGLWGQRMVAPHRRKKVSCPVLTRTAGGLYMEHSVLYEQIQVAELGVLRDNSHLQKTRKMVL